MSDHINHLAPWWAVPLVVIDFETTGLDPEADGVCEFAAVRFEDGEPVKRFSSLIDPGMPIPEEAMAVHGITNADVQGAPTLCRAVCDAVAAGLFNGAAPAAYNAPFDKPWLLSSGYRDATLKAFEPGWPWVDPLVVVRALDRYVKGSGRHKLEASCQRHGVQLQDAHQACSDAEAAGRLLYTLRDKLGDMTISEFLRRQELRREQQDRDFEEWKAKQQAKDAAS